MRRSVLPVSRLRLHHGPPRPSRAAGPGTVVFLLPAHDEAPRVPGVIARVPSHVRGRPVVTLVVDDGSSDDTAAVARAAGAVVVSHPTNRGLGAAVRTGFAWAAEHGAVALAFCDADGEYDPAELERVVGPVLDGRAHYVVGSRFAGSIGHMRSHRRAGNVVLTAVTRWVARLPITDGQSGYRALSAEALAVAQVEHDYNYAQVLTLHLAAEGFGYHEVPITYTFRTSGRSFVRLGRYLRRCTPAVARVVRRSWAGPSVSSPAGSAPPSTPRAA